MSKSVKQKKNQKNGLPWFVTAFFLTFVIAVVLSFLSETSLGDVPLPVAFIVLMIFILIGIVTDAIGVAVTVDDMSAYTAMAAKKIRGAKEAIFLIKNAERIANITGDVFGDICGIISGAMGAAITAKLLTSAQGIGEMMLGILISALTAAVMVSGKALGKSFAMSHSHDIVFSIAKLIAVFHRTGR